MANLSLKNVNKIYPNGFHAVHDFNLDIKHGEFIVFVGPSGCGKSTTLRMIAGLEDISDGDFLIEGKRANEMTPRQRGVTMVFQSYALYPNMTVYENMAFGLTLKGYDEELIEARVNATAKILGLTDYLDRMPRELSGGQRQRVAVGRAIIRRVDIFLMDEPLSNLDAKQRVTMRSEIIGIHRRVGATTIYVTHDQTEAMTMADRIVVMRDGYVQQVGTPHELYFNPCNMFVAGFIGEPPMNFLNCTVQNSVLKVEGTGFEIDITAGFDVLKSYEGRRVVFAFRPEAISLCKGDEKRSDGVIINAMVNLTELLGDNTNVYCSIDDVDMIIKIDPHDTPAKKQMCSFFVPDKAIYLFDAESEERIYRN